MTVQRMRQVDVRAYRNARLEIMDDGGDGWAAAIYITGEPGRHMLRNRVPHGLAGLLQEAEARVDRHLSRAWRRIIPDPCFEGYAADRNHTPHLSCAANRAPCNHNTQSSDAVAL